MTTTHTNTISSYCPTLSSIVVLSMLKLHCFMGKIYLPTTATLLQKAVGSRQNRDGDYGRVDGVFGVALVGQR